MSDHLKKHLAREVLLFIVCVGIGLAIAPVTNHLMTWGARAGILLFLGVTAARATLWAIKNLVAHNS